MTCNLASLLYRIPGEVFRYFDSRVRSWQMYIAGTTEKALLMMYLGAARFFSISCHDNQITRIPYYLIIAINYIFKLLPPTRTPKSTLMFEMVPIDISKSFLAVASFFSSHFVLNILPRYYV